MNAALFSLIAVTVGFFALIAWVYWPSRRDRYEALGRIPLENDTEESTEKPNE